MVDISGGCLCGGVRYSASAEPAMIAFCHCTDCQKQSGSAFSVNVVVPGDTIEISGETHARFEGTGDTGKKVTRHFCNRCGSPIANVFEAWGDLTAIKVGTMDDSSWVKPDIQIWRDSAQPWGVVPDGLKQAPKNP